MDRPQMMTYLCKELNLHQWTKLTVVNIVIKLVTGLLWITWTPDLVKMLSCISINPMTCKWMCSHFSIGCLQDAIEFYKSLQQTKAANLGYEPSISEMMIPNGTFLSKASPAVWCLNGTTPSSCRCIILPSWDRFDSVQWTIAAGHLF